MPQIEMPINNATSTELTIEGGKERITWEEFDYKTQIWVNERQRGGRGKTEIDEIKCQ